MGILNETPDRATDTANQIKTQVNGIYDAIKGTFENVFSMIWQNQFGLTPQQVFDKFGTDAASLFAMASAIQTAINTIQPGSLPQTPPYAFTINSDGTVTIGAHV